MAQQHPECDGAKEDELQCGKLTFEPENVAGQKSSGKSDEDFDATP
jgi:hypothetical protein